MSNNRNTGFGLLIYSIEFWVKLLIFLFILLLVFIMPYWADSVFCMDLQGRPRFWYIAAIREGVNVDGHTVILISNEDATSQAIGCTAEQAHFGLYGGAEVNGWELEYQFVPQQIWDQVLRTHPEIPNRGFSFAKFCTYTRESFAYKFLGKPLIKRGTNSSTTSLFNYLILWICIY